LVLAALLALGTAGARHVIREQAARERAGNEFAAAIALRVLANAEADFRAQDRDENGVNDFWTGDVAGLHGLAVNGRPLELISREIAQADARPLQLLASPPVPYHGYCFAALIADDSAEGEEYGQDSESGLGPQGKVHNRARIGFCAYPADYGKTGWHTWIINERSSLFKIDSGGKPILRWPSDEDLKRKFGRGD
jgi:hypothetical protein